MLPNTGIKFGYTGTTRKYTTSENDHQYWYSWVTGIAAMMNCEHFTTWFSGIIFYNMNGEWSAQSKFWISLIFQHTRLPLPIQRFICLDEHWGLLGVEHNLSFVFKDVSCVASDGRSFDLQSVVTWLCMLGYLKVYLNFQYKSIH